MDKLDRIYELNRILAIRRYPVSAEVLAEELQCSIPTVKRLIEHFRDRLNAPLIYDYEYKGYVMDRSGASYELPGLWLNSDEIHALLTTAHLLGTIQEGVLDEHIAPIKHRIEALLGDARAGHEEIGRRVHVMAVPARPTDLDHFRRLTAALLERKQLRVLYHGRARDETTERVLSPQRMVYYRSNWYLEAWCHLREGLRAFSLDRLQPVETLDAAALEIDAATLAEWFDATFGIFNGKGTGEARLRFSPEAAKWAADEQWHAQESGTVLADGSYELTVPYGEPPIELVMEILRYGPEVEVLAPDSLRELVRDALLSAAAQYQA